MSALEHGSGGSGEVAARDLVELVIPTYERPDLLGVAVESALAETPFMVTVLDDHSPRPVEEALDVAGLNAAHDDRLRVIRHPTNLGASLNILRCLEVARAPYTWTFTDDHVIPPGTADEIVELIAAKPEVAIFFWNIGLSPEERLDLRGLDGYLDMIERSRAVFNFSDVHLNRVIKTEVGRRYLKVDARFSHAQPLLGAQIAALADGLPTHVRGGALGRQQEGAPSGWSTSYAQRFRFDPAYLIPEAENRERYRAVVARHFPWRATLIDVARGQGGTVDEAFAADAAMMASHSKIPLRVRLEARLALFLYGSAVGRRLSSLVPRKRGAHNPITHEKMTW
jgi:glycosyltransferase involved in cell wall biosynthesis